VLAPLIRAHCCGCHCQCARAGTYQCLWTQAHTQLEEALTCATTHKCTRNHAHACATRLAHYARAWLTQTNTRTQCTHAHTHTHSSARTHTHTHTITHTRTRARAHACTHVRRSAGQARRLPNQPRAAAGRDRGAEGHLPRRVRAGAARGPLPGAHAPAHHQLQPGVSARPAPAAGLAHALYEHERRVRVALPSARRLGRRGWKPGQGGMCAALVHPQVAPRTRGGIALAAGWLMMWRPNWTCWHAHTHTRAHTRTRVHAHTTCRRQADDVAAQLDVLTRTHAHAHTHTHTHYSLQAG